MLKILIIEDNLEKLKAISLFLEKVCTISENDISYAEDINGGRTKLIQSQFDVLILDLVLPVNTGDDASPENGTGFLDELYYNPNINTPIHIIGLTEFDSVFNDFYENFEDKLWGLINFKLSSADWKEKLKSKIFYLQSFKKKYVSFLEQKSKYDIAIVTALNVEFEQLKRVGRWEKIETENDQIIYYESIISTKANNNIRVVATCINQMGMQAAAAVSSKLIGKFSPGLVIMTGICAGIKTASVNLGDIIIATQCWDYESGKISESDDGALLFKPDMRTIPTDQGLISKLTDYSNNKVNLLTITEEFQGNKPENNIKVCFGSVGSGPYVLSNQKYLHELISSDRKLVGIDMEGFGIYKAAQFHKNIQTVLIKGVSDFGDGEKADNYHSFASYISAAFTLKFVYHTF